MSIQCDWHRCWHDMFFILALPILPLTILHSDSSLLSVMWCAGASAECSAWDPAADIVSWSVERSVSTEPHSGVPLLPPPRIERILLSLSSEKLLPGRHCPLSDQLATWNVSSSLSSHSVIVKLKCETVASHSFFPIRHWSLDIVFQNIEWRGKKVKLNSSL